jgi:GntR family transcriptional regulator, transcriptional repressor for pyruvate dehydrogenase complex
MDLSPISRATSAQQAADQLLALFRAGASKPGDQLPPERELSERLKIGRSTVREALQILATLNVVQVIPGQGTFVKEPRGGEIFRADLVGFLIRDSAILDLLEAREMIEPQTLRLACLRASDEDLDGVAAMLDQHERALDAGEPIAHYARVFHTMLADLSRSSVAAAFIHSILELLQSRRRPDRTREEDVRELEEHREILRLVRARDAQPATEYLLRHIVSSAMIDLPPDAPAHPPTARPSKKRPPATPDPRREGQKT